MIIFIYHFMLFVIYSEVLILDVNFPKDLSNFLLKILLRSLI